MNIFFSSISNIFYALKNQWKWARKRVIYSVIRIPLTIILSLLGTYFPSLVIYAIENGLEHAKIVKILFIYFGVWVFIQIFESFRFCRTEMHRFLISNVYQLCLTEKHLSTDYANTDNPTILEKYSLAMKDSWGDCAPDEILHSIVNFVINLCGAVTYGAIIASVSPLFLIIIICSSIITFTYGKFKTRYVETHRKIWNKYERKMRYLIDVERKADYAKDIRAFCMAEWLDHFYNQQLNLWKHEKTKEKNIDMIGNFLSLLLILIQNTVVYTILINQFLDGYFDASTFSFLLSATTGLAAWIISIISSCNKMFSLALKIGYYREYLDTKEYFNHGVSSTKLTDLKPPLSIEFCDVSYQYSKETRNVLKNINFYIEGGKRIAIVGPNGAGKTTLVKLLCGMYLPSQGKILINGVPSDEYNIEDYYSLFSTVFQDIYLLPITIKEFLTTTDIEVDEKKMWSAIMRSGLYEKIKSLPNGVDTHLMKEIHDDGVELSGGEKQKLMIARALYKDAPIVVLDEPTASLDPISESNLYKQFDELTYGKTAIYISHRLSSTQFCDCIIFLDKGRIVECGTHAELMQKGGAYKKLFETQSKYYQDDCSSQTEVTI